MTRAALYTWRRAQIFRICSSESLHRGNVVRMWFETTDWVPEGGSCIVWVEKDGKTKTVLKNSKTEIRVLITLKDTEIILSSCEKRTEKHDNREDCIRDKLHIHIIYIHTYRRYADICDR